MMTALLSAEATDNAPVFILITQRHFVVNAFYMSDTGISTTKEALIGFKSSHVDSKYQCGSSTEKGKLYNVLWNTGPKACTYIYLYLASKTCRSPLNY